MDYKKWWSVKIILLAYCLVCNYYVAEARILIYQRITNQLIEEFNDMPAQFGANLPPNGLKVFVIPAADSKYGCEDLKPPPRGQDYPPTAKFVALVSRGGECTFECKVRVAQKFNYSAIIVYNNEGDDLEQMSAENTTGINISAIFVGQTTGQYLMSYYSPELILVINDELPFNINTQLILPFSILIGLCFLIMVVYMIYKCIRAQRRLRRYRLPKSMLKKIPIIRYTKNNTDLVYETCVICLEDFVEDDKVRVLPCRHPYHSHCIDPWLTQNSRVCPICKRKVFTKGETHTSRNRQPSLDSVTDTDDDTTPLLQQPIGSGPTTTTTAAAVRSSSTAAAVAAGGSMHGTTRHGTFRRSATVSNNNYAAGQDNGSDDENVLLAQQSPRHGARRVNPFDRAPNLPQHLSDQLIEEQPSLWSRINFSFFFRRQPTVISIAAPPYLETVQTNQAATSASTSSSLPANAAITNIPANASNNILNPNLSGSFKDDDDLPPHRSIYEPIGVPTPGTNTQTTPIDANTAAAIAADSAFLQTPTRGGIGVVALPNNSVILDVDVTSMQTQAATTTTNPSGTQRHQFLI